jgi:hypothetical protein
MWWPSWWGRTHVWEQTALCCCWIPWLLRVLHRSSLLTSGELTDMRVCMYACIYVCMPMYAAVGSFSRCTYCTLYTCTCLLLASVNVLVCVQLVSCWFHCALISRTAACVSKLSPKTVKARASCAYASTASGLLYFCVLKNVFKCLCMRNMRPGALVWLFDGLNLKANCFTIPTTNVRHVYACRDTQAYANSYVPNTDVCTRAFCPMQPSDSDSDSDSFYYLTSYY